MAGRIIYAVDTRKLCLCAFRHFGLNQPRKGSLCCKWRSDNLNITDNLSDNIKRGVRQKLRRGEWLNLAPFGYTNNPKTRNIEPHPTNARVITLAFEEYAKGSHGFHFARAIFGGLGVVT
jgi:hypothetical protein